VCGRSSVHPKPDLLFTTIPEYLYVSDGLILCATLKLAKLFFFIRTPLLFEPNSLSLRAHEMVHEQNDYREIQQKNGHTEGWCSMFDLATQVYIGKPTHLIIKV